MAASVVSICNQALGHIGQSQPIASLTEESEAAGACSAFFDQARDELLTLFPWPFALRRLAMALVAEEPNDDWAYAYRRPSDCLTARRVLNGTSRFSKPLAWEPGGDDSGGLVYTDEEGAALEYIARVTNPALFPPHFVNALSWLLATKISPVLSESLGDAARLRQGYDLAISTAKSHAANEGVADAQVEADAIQARI